MRAIVAHAIGAPEDLKIEEMPDPAPGPGEVLVDMKATAVNFPDLLVIEGKYQIIPPHPFVPGKEGAGTVAAVGAGVDGLSIGDRVMVQAEWGTYAEKLVLPADHCFPMPDGMGFEEAAAIGIALPDGAFRAGRAGRGQEGRAGAGHRRDRQRRHSRAPACQGRSAAPCSPGSRTMSKADVALENGADHIVDLTVENLRDSIRTQVKEACGTVDVVLESVGGEVFDGAIRALDFDGRAVIVGFTSGEIASFRTNYALLKVISVTGVNWAAYRDPRSGMGAVRPARALRPPRRGQESPFPCRRCCRWRISCRRST